MFRPIAATTVALVLVALAGCTETPSRGGPSPTLAAPPSSSAPVASPSGATEPLLTPPPPPGTPPGTVPPSSGVTVDAEGIQACRDRCERNFRICGDSAAITSEDRVEPLGSPRLFSQNDNCQYQLDRCLRRCSAPN